MNNDFNDGTPGTGWVATTGVDFTNPCGQGLIVYICGWEVMYQYQGY